MQQKITDIKKKGKKEALSELRCRACILRFKSQRTNRSQRNFFGGWRGNVGHCRLTSCYVFSAGMQGWTMVLLPLSHFSQEVKHSLPHREAFVLQKHSMSGKGITGVDPEQEKDFCLRSEQLWNRVPGTWFKDKLLCVMREVRWLRC